MIRRWNSWVILVFALTVGVGGVARADLAPVPSLPASALGSGRADPLNPELSLLSCERFDPEFEQKNGSCCLKRISRRLPNCAAGRRGPSLCNERTAEQLRWIERYSGDAAGYRSAVLRAIHEDDRKKAYCSGNDGFLAWGIPLLELPDNRVKLRSPFRCANFGVPRVIATLDWLGMQMHAQLPAKTELLVGDLSGPKGGCLAGMRGRRGHRSHTNGLDIDLAFPVAKGPQPGRFHYRFEPDTNWWFLKQLFSNPHSCVSVVYLDRKLIAQLAKVASKDPEWQMVRRHLKHVRFHRHHYHIRVKDIGGGLSCLSRLNPDEEDIEDDGATVGDGAGEGDGSSDSEREGVGN